MFHERELAFVVDDISALIKQVETKAAKPEIESTRFGDLSGTLGPCGVSLIVSESDTPLRHAVAPFAASIAARNTVILATTKFPWFFDLFQQRTKASLDASALHVVEVAEDDIDEAHVDHILVIGECELSCLPCAVWSF